MGILIARRTSGSIGPGGWALSGSYRNARSSSQADSAAWGIAAAGRCWCILTGWTASGFRLISGRLVSDERYDPAPVPGLPAAADSILRPRPPWPLVRAPQ